MEIIWSNYIDFQMVFYFAVSSREGRLIFFWLVVEPTHLKNISQIGSFPQVGPNIKNIWVATT